MIGDSSFKDILATINDNECTFMNEKFADVIGSSFTDPQVCLITTW